MKKEKFLDILWDIAPLDLQAEWDNSGMQIDLGREQVDRVLVCLDITEAVLAEAEENNCDFILAHHPLLFNPAKRILHSENNGRYIISAIKNGISVCAAHTCFDACPGGNNDYLMEMLGCRNFEPMQASPFARIGNFEKPVRLADLAEKLRKSSGQSGLRCGGSPEKLIRRIALCCGSGSDLTAAAAAEGAECYISGDFKHHDLLEAMDCGLAIIDAGHYGTEIHFISNMADKLRRRAGAAVEIVESSIAQNPLPGIF